MAAPVGNRFWEQRSSHGRKPIFENPEQLWKAACEYFEWVTDNPLEEAKAFAYEGEVTIEDLPKMRAMTLMGLCFFLDISDDTWLNYTKNKDFLGVCEDIKRVIFTQKFEGASAGLLNASIIARELGLSDTTKTEHSGKIDLNSVSDDALDKRIKELESKVMPNDERGET
ncbi:terminase small subunit [Acinetobacter ursingii]|uniref:terminase small subunit n=1 Tax=Acinetobacter ursingii TaxID=108980 RepID=UPI00124FDE49|nr:terminase small subunit [Acinetobacter ursingii]MEC8057686.1 terminase small subunit [Pseudomonadota bacterium]